MPWGPRVAPTSAIDAEGDKIYIYGQYSDVTGNLKAFMPVCKDLSDAAEFNQLNTTTQITVTGLGKRTAGKVCLTTNSFAGGVSTGAVPEVIGIYSTTNPNDTPSNGDIIRIVKFGMTPVQISGGQTANVGDYLVATNTSALAITTSRTGPQPSVGAYIGRVAAYNNQISVGQAPTQQGFSFGFLVNGYVNR